MSTIRVSKETRNKLKANTDLTELCGNSINLWGYFLALSHFLLKKEGKVGAVIPINICGCIKRLLPKQYHRNNDDPEICLNPIDIDNDIDIYCSKHKEILQDSMDYLLCKKVNTASFPSQCVKNFSKCCPNLFNNKLSQYKNEELGSFLSGYLLF